MEMVLPMNTGAEGVETAIKTARKWGYEVKGVAEGRAKIIVCDGQLPRPHDDDRQLLDRPGRAGGFGPFTPGFVTVPYGDADALAAAFDEDVVAFLVEPIQGEAGVIVPARGLPAHARARSAPSTTRC